VDNYALLQINDQTVVFSENSNASNEGYGFSSEITQNIPLDYFCGGENTIRLRLRNTGGPGGVSFSLAIAYVDMTAWQERVQYIPQCETAQ
jgi:hypothetical protein